MRQLNLVINKQVIQFYFDDDFCRDTTDDLLEKIMVNCYLEICNKYPNLKLSGENISVFIKNALLLPIDYKREQSALLQYTHTLPPRLRSSLQTKPVISRLKLAEVKDAKHTFEPKPVTQNADNDIHQIFNEFTQQVWDNLKDVKCQMQAQLIKSQIILAKEPINILAPDECTMDAMVATLSAKLLKEPSDTNAALHLKKSRNLCDELRQLPVCDSSQSRYNKWIDTHIKSNDQQEANPTLTAYIEQQKASLLKQIIEDKNDRIRIFSNQHYNAFSDAVNNALPTEYRIAASKESYLRKNIIAAIYAAARDYYFSILPEPLDLTALKQSVAFLEKRKSFNEKFGGIAEISSDTLMLSPLETCMKSLSALPLTCKAGEGISLESFINDALMRCAHINCGNTNTISYAEAFAFAKNRLNHFNSQPHLIQADNAAAASYEAGSLFKPVAAPGDGIIRNVSKTFGRVMDSLDSLARKLGSDSKLFEFGADVIALKDETAKAELIFLQKLAALKEHIATTLRAAENVVTQEEASYTDIYNKANDNIRAFQDLLQHEADITTKIRKLNHTRDSYRAKLTPYFHSSEILDLLAQKYEIREEQSREFEIMLIGKQALTELKDQAQYLTRVNASLPDCAKKISDLVDSSKKLDSLFTSGKRTHIHQTTVDNIEKSLRECHRGLEDIASAISSSESCWNNGKAGITAFAACDYAIESIKSFKQNLASRTYEAVFAPGKMPITAAIDLYRAAEQDLDQLIEAETKAEAEFKRIAPLDDTIIHVIHDKAAAARTAASAQLAAYKKDLYDLLLCNLAANAVCNFAHWQKAGTLLDNRINVIDQSEIALDHYKVPKSIFKLSTLISENQFDQWDTNPTKARALLAALATDHQTKHASTEIKCFRQKLTALAAEINDGEAHDIEAINDHLHRLNRNSRNKLLESPIVLQPPTRRSISHNKTFFENHPHFTHALIGLAVGFAITALVIGVCALSAFTGGAPLILAGTAALMTIGGAGFVSGLAVAAAVVSSTLGALIGFFASKGLHQLTAEKSNNAPAASKPAGNADADTSSKKRSPVKISLKPVEGRASTSFITDRKGGKPVLTANTAHQSSYNPFDNKY